jgi:arylsulfatase
MITQMDATVGKLVAKLKAQGRDKDTLILFTSDNGATHDVGGADSTFFDSTGGLRGRKGSVYEGGLRVPLIAWQPGTIKADTVSKHAAYFPDVLPTLMDAIGKADDVPKGIDGRSFLPELRGEKQPAHDHLIWEFAGYGGQQAILAGPWKALRRNLNKGMTTWELYHLDDDPRETTDVAAKNPEVVKRLALTLLRERSASKEFPIKNAEK